MPDPGTFAAVFATLFAAHHVGDHWVQTHHQAMGKGAAGWPGRLACARHVAGYTATAVVLLLVVVWLLHLEVSPLGIAVGQLVSAVTHYWADRRSTLRWLAGLLGKADFYQLGAPRPGRDDNPSLGTGAYVLDQSWHIGWLFVAALVTVIGGGS